ncbi:FGGY-family carbohydrate kinase [Roseinatronobacter alkalisoli]|uniref:FGGY-family carbohydrate kinase n=1 Tax=Roseinatronobacter alkalisoli TaxID=3028235 RepID=A0ABT5TC84_9RHOB|nr:FGGY-family carbohydrate kinase [Roseinatronobacter sp. HJB301]MDD7972730.1 FGGY-family carbohydrate kinase [Roseinatronobacter sp. HJB301]
MSSYVIGIDVGTGSARAGVFDAEGTLHGTGKCDVAMHRPSGGIAEQSSAQVWDAVCSATRAALADAGIDPGAVAGIGFDATCSLVVAGDRPLPVGDPDHPERDIIVWMDHRAVEQAARINDGGHDVLRYVGGRISPEMETPKLLWLKENRPQVFADARHFFDLTDFLTWKATNSAVRSTCTVTCKWTYLAHEDRWDADYFRSIGLAELVDDGFARIGARVVPPATPLGQGLTPQAARAMGLRPGIAVGAGLIDAHAGGIGTVAAHGGAGDPVATLGYVFGTSSCTMTTTHELVFVPGVWGPYYSAMVPGMWLNEGGQSVAGAAIDHLLRLHPAHAEAAALAHAEGLSLPDWLAGQTTADALQNIMHLHVVPEFLGNRAPFADPHARATISGLGMQTDLASLVDLYVAGICGLGYGLRQIVETQAAHDADVRRIAISGGAGRHPLIRQLLADTTGLPVDATASEEPVLLGAAMLGAVAGGVFADLGKAMPAMSRVQASYQPAPDSQPLHQARYQAFLTLQHTARDLRAAMNATIMQGQDHAVSG